MDLGAALALETAGAWHHGAPTALKQVVGGGRQARWREARIHHGDRVEVEGRVERTEEGWRVRPGPSGRIRVRLLRPAVAGGDACPKCGPGTRIAMALGRRRCGACGTQF